jgi:multisubunit Na+/H+ antiporter MnhE subunit
LYNIIHSPWTFFTFICGFIVACLVVIELEESQNNYYLVSTTCIAFATLFILTSNLKM